MPTLRQRVETEAVTASPRGALPLFFPLVLHPYSTWTHYSYSPASRLHESHLRAPTPPTPPAAQRDQDGGRRCREPTGRCFAWLVLTCQGASPRELILEACRRNNTDLLEETIADLASAASKAGKAPAEHVAQVLNEARDGLGNGCLHVAASYGSCTCTIYSQHA